MTWQTNGERRSGCESWQAPQIMHTTWKKKKKEPHLPLVCFWIRNINPSKSNRLLDNHYTSVVTPPPKTKTCNHPQKADITEKSLHYRSIALIIQVLILRAAIQERIKEQAGKFGRVTILCYFISLFRNFIQNQEWRGGGCISYFLFDCYKHG